MNFTGEKLKNLTSTRKVNLRITGSKKIIKVRLKDCNERRSKTKIIKISSLSTSSFVV